MHRLADAFDDQADALVDWLIEQAHRGDVGETAAVVGVVMDGGLTAGQAQRLHAAVDSLQGKQLLTLAALLGNITTWPLRQPGLARHFLSKAREAGADTAKSVRTEIVAATQLGTWTATNGVSPELESARTAAAAAAAAETDDELREDFENAHARYEATTTWIHRQRAEDDEDE
ncbi:hypothetical protein BU204_37635 [Actinophytocola xanthii]|uniref:Uncharacterized protein n=1 Tax=Actinophytocola xanthii TaxID=1912961 RepID=A0A1Q8BR35_9PSEU|nr:hypothetical protein BU204_37635 [Actinophytocola xanthii]